MPELTAILSSHAPDSPRIFLTESDRPGLALFEPGAREPTVTWVPRGPDTVLQDALLMWISLVEAAVDIAGVDADAATAARAGLWSPGSLDDGACGELLERARAVKRAFVCIRMCDASMVPAELAVLGEFSLEYEVFRRVAYRRTAPSWTSPGTLETVERAWSDADEPG